jgi:uncharacterized protein (DUF697 family)/predicted flap endonuclease-1-like 5' DNA nuclease
VHSKFIIQNSKKELMSNFEQYSELNESRQQQANDIIVRRTMYAAGTGLIPIPIVDAAALLGVQMYMIRDIAKIYKLEFKEQRVKFLINTLVGDVATVSLFKFIPGLGTFLGGTSFLIIGAASTYALGQVFIKHFEEGGTLLNFDPVASESFFKKKVAEGKNIVKDLRKQKPFSKTENTDIDKKSASKSKTSLSTINHQSKKLNKEILELRKEIEGLKQQRNQRTVQPVLNKEKETKKVEKTIVIDLNDLQIIKGIGPKTAKALIAAGIQNIKDLSQSTPETLHDILEKAEGKFTLIAPDTWILQAQLAAEGNLDTFYEFQKKLGKS